MPDAAKAAHYLQQLDDARCDENWDAVPELVRKVRKHAPDRSCLALTAEIEHAIAKANLKPSVSSSADAVASSPSGLDPTQQLPALLDAIDHGTRHAQDLFQARVCAGWLLWVLRDYAAALDRLPHTLLDTTAAEQQHQQQQQTLSSSPSAPPSDADASPTGWTKVCALKSAYLRANCLARDGQREAALGAFDAALPALGPVWAAGPGPRQQQMRYWAELFLTEYCMLAAQALREGRFRSLREPDCLACFRTWGRYWAGGKASGALPGGYGFRGSVPRRQVWAEYYLALSEILQGDLPFPTGCLAAAAGNNNESSARSQLRAELKKVETIYQGLLFSETRFPRADEERAEVEDFVRRLMQNWTVLNGRGWKEHDLGTGGRDALCRGTLDTLYGAAAKTYHSTATLRHLFTVHLAVAEFELASVAFDSWLELVKKGKARVQKTGHPEPALDDDATVFQTISTCIVALCRFGSREAAERARKLAEELEEMVEKEEHGDSDASAAVRGEVPPNILALSWQAIGIAHAQWARMTYDSESRSSIHEKAIQCLRKSLSSDYGDVVDVRGVFALGLLYAEQRKLSASIELVKTALLADKVATESQELLLGPYWRERSLIPLWHLLALMLSARQEYFMAARACEGAIEQFKDPCVLFGSRHLNGAYRSEHLNEAEIKDEKAGSDGIVDEMDDYEKEGILQIKMTQLAILELVEGSAVAVNASAELLTLFPRLFGDLEQKLELSSKAEPPKSSAATLRSLRGSVFGRSDKGANPRQSTLNNANTSNNEKLTTTTPSRPQTMQTTQSVATTTATVESSNDPAAADRFSSQRSMRSQSTNCRSRNSLRKRDRSGSRQRALSSAGPPVPPLEGDKYSAAFDDHHPPQSFTSPAPPPSRAVESPPSRARTATAAVSRQSELGGVAVASFAPLLPHVQFSPDHSRRRRKAILVKVWLVIAGFYRRAGLLEDAQKAIAEAQKVAQSLEADAAASDSLAARQVGWGMDKSVEEVLADVWAEKGNLSLARDKPYQARADFDTALMHFADHPGSIVGLSTILLDIYSEKLLPPPAVPGLDLGGLSLGDESIFPTTEPPNSHNNNNRSNNRDDRFPSLPSLPLGLGPTRHKAAAPPSSTAKINGHAPTSPATATATANLTTMTAAPGWSSGGGSSGLLGPPLPPPHRATSLPLNDRLAARDRAHGLLAGLTRRGTGWNDAEAWFALARACEESGQPDKARDALWWCVELEDARGAREWRSVQVGGYVLE